MSNHRWFICSMCGPAVLCGTCGNNSCNGGIGRVGGSPGDAHLAECPDCRASWEWEKTNPCPPELTKEWEENRDKFRQQAGFFEGPLPEGLDSPSETKGAP